MPLPKMRIVFRPAMAIEGNPDMFLVACDACGWRTGKYKDINHATREWNHAGEN